MASRNVDDVDEEEADDPRVIPVAPMSFMRMLVAMPTTLPITLKVKAMDEAVSRRSLNSDARMSDILAACDRAADGMDSRERRCMR